MNVLVFEMYCEELSGFRSCTTIKHSRDSSSGFPSLHVSVTKWRCPSIAEYIYKAILLSFILYQMLQICSTVVWHASCLFMPQSRWHSRFSCDIQDRSLPLIRFKALNDLYTEEVPTNQLRRSLVVLGNLEISRLSFQIF